MTFTLLQSQSHCHSPTVVMSVTARLVTAILSQSYSYIITVTLSLSHCYSHSHTLENPTVSSMCFPLGHWATQFHCNIESDKLCPPCDKLCPSCVHHVTGLCPPCDKLCPPCDYTMQGWRPGGAGPGGRPPRAPLHHPGHGLPL